jgi:DNA polymerase-1
MSDELFFDQPVSKPVKRGKTVRPRFPGVNMDQFEPKVFGMYGLITTDEFLGTERSVGEILDSAGKTGMAVDMAVLQRALDASQEVININQAIVNEAAKREVKIGSSADLPKLLFEEMGFKPLRTTPSGKNACNDSVLARYAGNKVVDAIRVWKSARSTMSLLQSFKEAMDPDGRIRYEFLPWDCPTGRIYVRDFNIQQLPPTGRQAIIPDAGYKFLYADYKQMEYRILLSIAGEVEAFPYILNGGDVHVLTAAMIYDKAPESVNSDERDIGKMVNYAISYGASAFTLALQTGKPKEQCQEWIVKYFTKFPRIASWIKNQLTEAMSRGSVRTIFGHVRDLASIIKEDVPTAMRMAVNTQIQGANAGFLKKAISNLSDLSEKGFKLCACVHDSFLIQVPECYDQLTAERLVADRVQFFKSSWLPLEVDFSWGKNWGEAAHAREKLLP